MLLLIDNYDSFTYNIYQALGALGAQVKVVRNDAISLEAIQNLNPTHIIIGPGPKTPKEAGISLEVIDHFKGKIPILGICLGHQAIMAYFGMPIVRAKNIVHGKIQPLRHNSRGLFRGITPLTPVARYHSLAGKKEDLPDCLEITATTPDDEIMAVEHKQLALFGVQFHPESIGSPEGQKMLSNFLFYRRDATPIKDLILKLLQKQHLSYQESYSLMDEITEGNLHDAQLGAFLAALEIKGLEAEELAGFSDLLKAKSLAFPKPKEGEKRLDIVGTGGSGYKTFNVSSLSALLLASMGIKITKHGNRAISSQCGSADIFELLGIDIEMDLDSLLTCFERFHFAFCFAPKFHNALKNVAPARRALGFRTVFNLIGPLANPASCTHQVLGVFNPDLVPVLAKSLKISGLKRALVVSGLEGYDEISLTRPSCISELKNGKITTKTFDPRDFGWNLVSYDHLKGGDKFTNLRIAQDLLAGVDSPKMDLLCLNAGAAIYVSEKADSIPEGARMAKKQLQSGALLDFVKKLQDFSQETRAKRGLGRL